MFESVEPPQAGTEIFEDVTDALLLGFWGMELEPCEVGDLPIGLHDDETIKDAKLRQKGDYEAFTGVSVVISHFSYISSRNGIDRPCEFMQIVWMDDDETNILYDLLRKELGTYEEGDDGESHYLEIPFDAENFNKVRNMAKLALVAVMN